VFKKREYQFEVQAERDGKWVTVQAEEDEGQAKKFAEGHLSSAEGRVLRVIRTRVFENGELGSDHTIWEEPIPVKAERPVSIVPIDDAPMCETFADLECFEARRCATRLLRRYLDRHFLTATELMHSMREFRRLRDADMLLPSAVSRVSGIQARNAGVDQRKRNDDLFRLVDRQFDRVREAASRSLPVIDAAGVAKAWSRAEEFGGPDQQFFYFGVMLSKHLAGAQSWDAKLERIIELKVPRIPQEADIILGEMIAEVIDGASVIQDLLGRQPDLVSALKMLSDLAVGGLEIDKTRQPVLAALNETFRSANMDVARDVLTARIAREVGGRNDLTRYGGDEDVDALSQIVNRLVDENGRFAGGSDMAEAIASRFSRRFDDLGVRGASERLTLEMTELFKLPSARITFLCELLSVPFGHRLAADIMSVLTAAITRPKHINNFTYYRHPVAKKLRAVLMIRDAIQSASMRDKEKRIFRERLDQLTCEYLESDEVLGRVDDEGQPLVKRLRGLLSLQLSGLLWDGPVLDLIRNRVITHLTKSTGLEGALAELPEGERPAIRAELKGLLSRAGFGA
tara:strand:+ start:257 stop:1969 length:1713 start_codon:yes stop_codon:yes gene_type:complete